jgi:hypothetical protein
MCCKGPKKEPVKTIKQEAKLFHETIKKAEKKEDVRVQKAEKAWSAIEDHIKKEDKVAHEASLLGLPPPPPLYNHKELDKAQKRMARKVPRPLTDKEKANCQRQFRRIETYKKEAAAISSKANAGASDIDRAQDLGLKADKLKQIYDKKCSLGGAPPNAPASVTW